jgi:hypothetical protein
MMHSTDGNESGATGGVVREIFDNGMQLVYIRRSVYKHNRKVKLSDRFTDNTGRQES